MTLASQPPTNANVLSIFDSAAVFAGDAALMQDAALLLFLDETDIAKPELILEKVATDHGGHPTLELEELSDLDASFLQPLN